MLGVISTHEPIRGEFAEKVREMLSAENVEVKQPKSSKKSRWVVVFQKK